MSPPSSSIPPAGLPESSGNVKYAIVAIVLVLAAGGLFAWRALGSRGAPAPAPTTVTMGPPPPPPVNPRIEDIPLPPPPEEKPEGGAGPRVVYVPGGGCEGQCTGKAPDELASALQVRAQQARRCYNRALSSDSSLKGKVSIRVRIGPTGNVCSATVASNDMGSPAVADCAANMLRATGNYPPPRGGCVEANIPLTFVPQGSSPGGGP
jgi:hypothetical protein